MRTRHILVSLAIFSSLLLPTQAFAAVRYTVSIAKPTKAARFYTRATSLKLSGAATGSRISRIQVQVNRGRAVTARLSRKSKTRCTWSTGALKLRIGSNAVLVSVRVGARTKTRRSLTVIVSRKAPVVPPPIYAPPLSRDKMTSMGDIARFLYAGPGAIQTGVAAGVMEPSKVAIVRGKVRTRTGSPIPGVTMTVLSHPEYGKTTTHSDGSFDMAVNGGATYNFVYEKTGLLPLQRDEQVPARDFAIIEDVVMIALDARTSAVDGGDATVQTIAGSTVTDGDGTRQATLVFQPGTAATMEMSNGTTRPLDAMTVRATEYTVGDSGPDAMPAGLPPNVAYTYCVDYSIDQASAAGAAQVDFSKPVVTYTDNFLGFPAGTTVPLGYYDEARGHWVGADSGLVITDPGGGRWEGRAGHDRRRASRGPAAARHQRHRRGGAQPDRRPV